MTENASKNRPIVSIRKLFLGAVMILVGLASLPMSPARAASPTGVSKVLVILTKWSGVSADSVTQSSAQTLIGTTVNNWFKEVSNNLLSLTATATPWLDLPAGQAPCSNQVGYQNAALAAASAAGYNEANYDQVMFYFPVGGCLPLGSLGGKYTYLPSGNMNLRVAAHELTHNYSIAHASAVLGCKDALGQPVPWAETGCEPLGQGDPYDNMGASVVQPGGTVSSVGHLNAYFQEKLGWLTSGRIATVTTGTYSLTPLESTAASLQALKVTAGVGGRSYWIEYRTATGADSFLSWPNPFGAGSVGIVVHTTDPYGGTYVLDMSPTGSISRSALLSGQSWTDPTGTLTISAGSVNASVASVSILALATPPNAPSAPTSVSAMAGDGQATVNWAAPASDGGAPVTGYTVTASPGGASANAGIGATSAVVTGLTNGTAYTFTVQAANIVGISPPSAPSNSVTPVASTVGTGNGLRGEYFDNSNFTTSRMVRTDPTVNFNWGNGSPSATIGADTFSVRWTGNVEAQFSQTYTFTTKTDDGVRLWVNGQKIIDKWVNQAATEVSGTITLAAGAKYTITMEYFENTGGAVAQLYWSSPSTPKQIVPKSQLYS